MKQTIPGKVLSDRGDQVTLELTVAEWIDTLGHPRQRDTKHHSKAHHWRNAKTATGAQQSHLSSVTGAILDNTLYKVDGHTRAYLWETDKLPHPDRVIVTAYRLTNIDELNALYSIIDLPSAAESPRHKVTGAYRESGLVMTSRRLSGGNITDALHMALRGEPKAKRSKKQPPFDVYQAVSIFASELKIIDEWDVNPKTFCTGILAAALVMLALDPKTKKFFVLLNEDRGVKREGKRDPIEGISHAIKEIRMTRNLHQGITQLDLFARCLTAVHIWKEGSKGSRYWLQNMLYAYKDTDQLLKDLREKKNITNNLTL